jgi:hypothetical protein
VDRSSIAKQEGSYLLAEVLVGDYRPGGGQGGTGYSCFVHKSLLMGHVPGSYRYAGTSSIPPGLLYLCGLIIPLYCRITALICCIYLNILVSYSVVAMSGLEEQP